MSIIVMVNEKFREGIPPWEGIRGDAGKFASFFQRFLRFRSERSMKPIDKLHYLLFCINIFGSLEEDMVRSQVLRLVSLPLWHNLSQGRLKVELQGQTSLAKHWKHLAKKEAKAAKKEGDAHVPITERPEVTFIPEMVDDFLEELELVPEAAEEGKKSGSRARLLFCERFVEWLVDLLSQLPTRRFTRALLEDSAVLIKIKHAKLISLPEGKLFAQLVDLLEFYMNFEIDDHTGEPLSDEEVSLRHSERVTQLQRLCFKFIEPLRELALSNCGQVSDKRFLSKELGKLTGEQLRHLATKQLCLINEMDSMSDDLGFLTDVILKRYEGRKSQREAINEMPLYPTESVLWDDSQIPVLDYTGEQALALPKLNLQFLTAHDYLLRNFNLFRLEATYEIREDLTDILGRVGARQDDDGNIVFTGWSRMAIPVSEFTIVEVKKPNVGEVKPGAVTADVVFNTRFLRGDVRAEWDELKEHDVLFLLTIRPPTEQEAASMYANGRQPGPMEKYGLVYCRGCEVIEVKDEDGHLMNDFTGRVKPDQQRPPAGLVRTLTVALDTAQYQADTNKHVKEGGEDVYTTFNLLMRRKPKENNFKAVLESIRDLMNEPEASLPPWLHDIFLGYGDPAAAHYLSMDGKTPTVDFKDTFLDYEHLKASFPGNDIKLVNNSDKYEPVPPFRITFPWGSELKSEVAVDGKKRNREEALSTLPRWSEPLIVESYTPPNPGPYPQDQPRKNSVRFTPVQVEAILSGVQPGLSMVVGPPGTGKTDVAVQIMNVLYHTNPDQRTLLITHSNQALNDLFTKIMERDIPARYLLRLGQGEQDLDTELDFSRVGRVNAMLERRLQLLAEVEKMAIQFGVAADVAYTCETASHFWLLHVLSRWEKFRALVEPTKDCEALGKHFPFTEYFSTAPQPLFKGASFAEDWGAAEGCFRHLRTMFQELEECRAFELLKGQRDRVNYLMTRQAKIVAMTCTHAALKRGEFLRLGFKYDNLLMEESAQILEIETFIPMLLQKTEDGVPRLKRVVLIGDHHQLPPVVKNQAFQKYSHLDQSLFTRFVRLNTPYTELNAQGRARPSLANLYNWRYRDLGNLPNVCNIDVFKRANPGFRYDFQFIDVPDFLGRGESEPTPYFYQNLGEAEYVTSLFCYMRLRGYPANKISILTTYNGQKHLIRDVIARRCNHPALGRPRKVATVDKYQGQQNDFIILSLVRSKAVGHLRDVRRLTVAMSRARLGLYIVGRRELFGECFELQPTMRQLLARPADLVLVPDEMFDSCERKLEDDVAPERCMQVQGVESLSNMAIALLAEWDKASYEALQQQWHDYHAAQEAAADEAAAAIEAARGRESDQANPEVAAMDTEETPRGDGDASGDAHADVDMSEAAPPAENPVQQDSEQAAV
mmetsp:Transcript_15961/g.37841  ORF Transcript_15961/g.37841 Transcript_15961/m.37841 type:complete len:1392 (+) Transcript_15961:941-5116(+)